MTSDPELPSRDPVPHGEAISRVGGSGPSDEHQPSGTGQPSGDPDIPAPGPADPDGPSPEHAALIAERGYDPLDDDQWPATGNVALGLGLAGLLLIPTWFLIPVSGVLGLFGLGMGLRARRLAEDAPRSPAVPIAAVVVNALVVAIASATIVFQMVTSPLFRS